MISHLWRYLRSNCISTHEPQKYKIHSIPVCIESMKPAILIQRSCLNRLTRYCIPNSRCGIQCVVLPFPHPFAWMRSNTHWPTLIKGYKVHFSLPPSRERLRPSFFWPGNICTVQQCMRPRWRILDKFIAGYRTSAIPVETNHLRRKQKISFPALHDSLLPKKMVWTNQRPESEISKRKTQPIGGLPSRLKKTATLLLSISRAELFLQRRSADFLAVNGPTENEKHGANRGRTGSSLFWRSGQIPWKRWSPC